MKKIILSILLLATVMSFTACADMLDTSPSNNTSEDVAFATVDGAQAVIDGTYRYMYTQGNYTNGSWGSENFGLASVIHAHDIVGDDMVKRDAGSQWFWYDYLYWVRGEITSAAERPTGWWTFFYKIIATSNSVIANLPNATGSAEAKDRVLGQALAMRAFAYYYLVNIYQLTYAENPDAPGVPIYTEPTDIKTKGKPRGTVSDVYTQINEDLDESIIAFKNAPARKHSSHIDLYVAYGFKARVALMQRNWQVAKENATLALSKPELVVMNSSEVGSGFNSISNKEWMWGAEIIEAQSTTTYSFFSHLDAREGGGYAKNSAVQVSHWLYSNLSDNDIRKTVWFNKPRLDQITDKTLEDYKTSQKQVALKLWENDQNSENSINSDKGFSYPDNSYVQTKFLLKASGNWAADYVYMRASEMYLILAEANCMLGAYAEARTALHEIMDNRDADYDASIFSDGNVPTFGSYADEETFAKRNLLDEVYFQRRIELWGEGFRCFDLMRQKIAATRIYPETNFASVTRVVNELTVIDERYINNYTYENDKWAYTMQLPMAEFTSNPSMNYSTDQNPAW